ncbi:hypothetical protein RCL_jg24878.t1 [Rhizophagus clarus]|uniref:Uncharacterized protein n=1 Tax=Rhizophagus clarus TaxID=94130 RepID=A0A8H3LT86_9GLOM|nr:hypothetical protein RCL_jg24878.t1 [Rhizophagus clarus]
MLNNYVQINSRENSDHLFELLTDLNHTNDFYDVNVTQKVIPRQIDRLYLLSNNREIMKWRKESKYEWKFATKEVIYPNSYLTDVEKWIYSCKKKYPFIYDDDDNLINLALNVNLQQDYFVPVEQNIQ